MDHTTEYTALMMCGQGEEMQDKYVSVTETSLLGAALRFNEYAAENHCELCGVNQADWGKTCQR